MSARIGVDIGGTFTDLLLYDEVNGEIRVAKVPTTPASPDEGCLHAVAAAADDAMVARTGLFFHGTTVGLNALLERRGTKVGMLCTRGFRDVLEIRRGDRSDSYGLFWQPPEPLVPRRLRLPVLERIGANGDVVEPVAPADIEAAARVFAEEGVRSVAIAFMNAYASGANERRAAELLRAAGYDGEISLSHEISGEYREYERTTTTVVDAFVRGRMARYLDRVEQGLAVRGFTGTALITRSGGGSMLFAEAGGRPFETIMSGPVAGVEGASKLAQRFDLGDLITADVGGTSFDTSLVTNGQPVLRFEGEIGGMPLQSSWVDVRSIGAGGGSVAWIDAGGLLRVGPRSAGAVPGPACYARGGEEPCTTDAALYLGMLGDGRFESGLVLDRALAEAALRRVAEPLGLSLDDAARGILAIAASAMGGAIREITVEQGLDPRGMTLLAFGGAGPLMATLLADEMHMGAILVPPHAGNFSAWGLLNADIVREAAQTRPMTLGPDSEGAVNAILAELFARVARRSGKEVEGEARFEATLDMRYAGQEHSLPVPVPLEDGRLAIAEDALRARFRDDYRRTFGIEMRTGVEIVSVRVRVRIVLSGNINVAKVDASSAPEGEIDGYSFQLGRRVPFRTVHRSTITDGVVIAGPAIVTEATTTTYVDAGYACRLDASGCLRLDRVA